MIGRLRGRLVRKSPPELTLEVNGVGYDLEAPLGTFTALPPLDTELTLHTHLVVRDDAHLLYGFATERERSLFRLLLKVNGIGTRLALVVLSGIDADEFARCVAAGDALRLTALPGIGKKTAERMLVELRDRLSDWAPEAAPVAIAAPSATADADPVSDAVRGLVALGYRPQDASRYVCGIDTAGQSSEQIIRAVLRSLVRA